MSQNCHIPRRCRYLVKLSGFLLLFGHKSGHCGRIGSFLLIVLAIRPLIRPRWPDKSMLSSILGHPVITPAETAKTQVIRKNQARSGYQVGKNPLNAAFFAIRTFTPTSWRDQSTIRPSCQNPDILCLGMSVSLQDIQQTRPNRTRTRPLWPARSANAFSFRYPDTPLTGQSQRCYENSPTGKVSALSAERPNWRDTVELTDR